LVTCHQKYLQFAELSKAAIETIMTNKALAFMVESENFIGFGHGPYIEPKFTPLVS